MKIENTAIHGMEIELKAKSNWEKRYNKEAAMAAWNFISILAHEAAEMYRLRGCDALADQAEEFANQIYGVLEAHGAYKDC